jgi:hypothetical protein
MIWKTPAVGSYIQVANTWLSRKIGVIDLPSVYIDLSMFEIFITTQM